MLASVAFCSTACAERDGVKSPLFTSPIVVLMYCIVLLAPPIKVNHKRGGEHTPGLTDRTIIPSSLNDTAHWRVNMFSAAFETLYAAQDGEKEKALVRPIDPSADDMLMTFFSWLLLNSGSIALVTLRTPMTLLLSTISRSSLAGGILVLWTVSDFLFVILTYIRSARS